MQRAYLKIYIFYDMHMHLSFKSVLVNERPTDGEILDRQDIRICWGDIII